MFKNRASSASRSRWTSRKRQYLKQRKYEGNFNAQTDCSKKSSRSTTAYAILFHSGQSCLDTLFVLHKTQIIVSGQIETFVIVNGQVFAVFRCNHMLLERMMIPVDGRDKGSWLPLSYDLIFLL